MNVHDINNTYATPFAYVVQLLDGKSSRKICNNTELVANDDDSVSVWLHATEIIRAYASGRTVLRTGGWQSVTTKQRLNAFLPNGAYIGQKDFVWSVWERTRNSEGALSHNRIADFQDGMALNFNSIGEIESWVYAPDKHPLADRLIAETSHKVALCFVMESRNDPTPELIAAYLSGTGESSPYHYLRNEPIVLNMASNLAQGMIAAGMRP